MNGGEVAAPEPIPPPAIVDLTASIPWTLRLTSIFGTALEDRQLKLVLADGRHFPLYQVKDGQAIFRSEGLRELDLDAGARLRSGGPEGKSWRLGHSPWLWLLAAVPALLWVVTAFALGWIRFVKSPSAGSTADAPDADAPAAATNQEAASAGEPPAAASIDATSEQAPPIDSRSGATHWDGPPSPRRTSGPVRPPTTLDPPRPVVVPADVDERLARMAGEWWATGSSDLEILSATAQRESLQLFEWREFSEVLRTSAPSTTPLHFARYEGNARGPVFLGRREVGNKPLYVVPTSVRAFAGDQALSALRALFDLDPAPTSKSFQFQSLRRPCLLNPSGARYRIGQRGAIVTDQGRPPGTPLSPPPPAEPLPTTIVGSSLSGELDAAMRKMRQELERSLSSLARLEAAQGETNRRLAELTESFRATRTAASMTPRAEALSSGDTQLVVRAELDRFLPRVVAATVSELSAPLSPPEAPEAGDKPLAVAPPAGSLAAPEITPPPPLPAENSQAPEASTAIAPAPPTLTADQLRAYDWIPEALASFATGDKVGSPQDYSRSLVGLGQFLHGKSPLDLRLTFCRVTSDSPSGNVFALESLKLTSDSQDQPRFVKEDDSLVTLESVWQVFAAVMRRGAGATALVFPWSRLDKGAPVVAERLVDVARSGPLTEFSRCLEPAVLVWAAQQSGFVAIQRMVVGPAEAPPGRS